MIICLFLITQGIQGIKRSKISQPMAAVKFDYKNKLSSSFKYFDYTLKYKFV